MNLRSIPRAAVGGYIKAVRWPIDRVLGRAGRSAPERAVDRVDATARGVAGTVLGDDELKRDAARRSAAVDERARADKLRGAAEAQSQVATERLDERRTQAEQRREQAARTAERKREQAEKDREAKARKAKQAEQRRKRAAEKTAAQREEAIESEAKRERLDALEAEKTALAEKEEAVTATDEARRLEAAAGRAKAQRKSA
jgi:hypothetical protein